MDKSIPAAAAHILEFVYNTDAGKPIPQCYQVIFGNRQIHLTKPITAYTLKELLDSQKNWSSKKWVQTNWSKNYKTASSASGAAQFMRDTLLGLCDELKLEADQVFDSNLQDRLAYHLLKRRGYASFMSGKIGMTEFAKRLAQEWASFPVLASTKGAHRDINRGQSYYAGDGVNKALVAPETIEKLLREAKAMGSATVPVPPPPPDVPVQDTAEQVPASTSTPSKVGVGAAGGVFIVAIGYWTSTKLCDWFGVFCQ